VRHVVGYFVGLWREVFALDKPAKWLCIAEVFPQGWRGSNARTQLPLVIPAREVIHLAGSLVEDLLALINSGKYGLISTLGDKAIETGVLGEDVDFFFEC
jgi:hypothetical protein